MFRIISYYQFNTISSPVDFCREQRGRCLALGLKGRIYVAREGINGTLTGSEKDLKAYRDFLVQITGFENTEFKDDACDSIPFERLVVKVRPEIVALRSSVAVDVKRDTGKFLSPREWKAVLESEEDYILLDVRNEYETQVGHFTGAVLPKLDNFYDFPQWLEETSIPKGKKVLMYCTGGIRCEKFSALMKNFGYKDVNQLRGGILNYAKEEQGKHFQGKCFVFDDRLTTEVNPAEKEPIGRCEITGAACDTFINCANFDCNRLFLCSEQGAQQLEGCCSEECRKAVWRRPFDPNNIYATSRRWYHYFEQKLSRKT